ncbi:MAG: response regulator transcription factor [Planctomycetota bacterium]
MSEPEPAAATVLLVDDHGVVRSGLRTLLEADGRYVVDGEAGTVNEALQRLSTSAPDVALVDLRLPDGDGIDLVREVRRVSPCTRVLVLTSSTSDEDLVAAMSAGAHSYVRKDDHPSLLLLAIERTLAGESILSPKLAHRLVARESGAGASDDLGLTDREREILLLIGDGWNNAKIAAELAIAEKTVKGHVSNILAKLHLTDRTQAAVLAWRRGLMGPPDSKG